MRAGMIGQITLVIFMVAGLAATASAAPPPKNPAGATNVKNVDEPGRVPYQAFAEFSTSGCNVATDCANFNLGTDPDYGFPSVMVFDAPVVPAGKRLVIAWISAALTSTSTSNILSLQSVPSLANTNLKWQYAGPWFLLPGALTAGMSSAAFVTYEGGERPHIRVHSGVVVGTKGNVTINGYLIDATN